MGLRDILEAATPGPWEVDASGEGLDVYAPEHKTATVWVHLAGPMTMGDDADAGVKARAMADAQLVALAPELAALVLDMGDFLREIEDVLERDEASDWFERDFHSLLARLDQLGKEQSDG